MAISANTVFEVRTGGSDSNGGGFVTGAAGTDRSQQDSPHATLTEASVIHSTTTQINVSAGDYTVTANDVGNILQITGGTATAGYYQITVADVPNNRWTVDRAAGTAGQTVVGRMGGALASPGGAAAAASVSGNKIWVKAGTYTLSTASAGKGGPALAATSIRMRMEGYSSTRGDRAGRPVLDAGAQTTLTLFSGNGANTIQEFVHLEADGNSGSGVSGFLVSGNGHRALDCIASHCDQASQLGFTGGTSGVYFCKAFDCATGFGGSNFVYDCWADACATGFAGGSQRQFSSCLATNCTSDGFEGANDTRWYQCTADGNAGNGFGMGTARQTAVRCVSTNNGGYGFATSTDSVLEESASYNNTSGRTNATPFIDFDPVTLSGDPWVNAAGDDYRPNDTAGAGAELRARAGFLGQTQTRDLGAVQHSDPVGGGGGMLVHPGMGGGMRG